MNKATPYFVKLNAFLAAKKILAIDEAVDLPEAVLAQAWETLYDLSGRARPADSWNPGTWMYIQAVKR